MSRKQSELPGKKNQVSGIRRPLHLQQGLLKILDKAKLKSN